MNSIKSNNVERQVIFFFANTKALAQTNNLFPNPALGNLAITRLSKVLIYVTDHKFGSILIAITRFYTSVISISFNFGN